MTPIEQVLHRKTDPGTRILFTAGNDPTVLRAASVAARQGLVTPMLLGKEDVARDIAPDVPVDQLMFLDVLELVPATPPLELASLLVREGVAHGALLGPGEDTVECARAMEHEETVSAVAFLDFPAGSSVALAAANLNDDPIELAEDQLTEFFGPSVEVRRLGVENLSSARFERATGHIFLCDKPDFEFRTCGILRAFGAAHCYGSLLFGSRVPTAVLRPEPTVDDVLGSLTLLAARIVDRDETTSPLRRRPTHERVRATAADSI